MASGSSTKPALSDENFTNFAIIKAVRCGIVGELVISFGVEKLSKCFAKA